MANSIQHQFFFPHPPERVWEYLTRSELMEQWLMKNDFQPIIGFDFQFRTGPIASLNFDGIIYCKVLEIVPFKKLSYSWKSGPGEGKVTVESVVVYLDIYKALMHGWVEKLQNIDKLLKAAG